MNTDEAVAKGYAKFVRSISFDNFADYLWGEGTAFFVKYKKSMYLLTAKHNIIKDGENMAQHLFIALEGNAGPVPFDRCSFFKIAGGCEESEDFALFHVDSDRAKNMELNISALVDFAEFEFSMPDVLTGSPLRIVGYPSIDERYDWDRRKIHNHMLIKDGHHSPSDFGASFGQLKGAPSDIQYSGISGSPVLGIAEGQSFLAGIVIRATSSSGIIHYVKVDDIAKAVFAEYESYEGESTNSILSRL